MCRSSFCQLFLSGLCYGQSRKKFPEDMKTLREEVRAETKIKVKKSRIRLPKLTRKEHYLNLQCNYRADKILVEDISIYQLYIY